MAKRAVLRQAVISAYLMIAISLTNSMLALFCLYCLMRYTVETTKAINIEKYYVYFHKNNFHEV